MDYRIISISAISFVLLSCSAKPQNINSGIVRLKTVFYDSKGAPSFTDYKEVWYRNSLTIEEVKRANFVTIDSQTTMTFSTLLFRFIDLQENAFYDYNHFSDTALPFNKKHLPDSMMTDFGWSYYSHKVRRIQGVPQELSDTVIGLVSYKRIRFNFFGDSLAIVYKIGYYRCDGKGRMFSLEKKYSEKINCTMTKFDDFYFGSFSPFATTEIEFLSDSLTKEEHKVFDAWEQNEKKYPVNK